MTLILINPKKPPELDQDSAEASKNWLNIAIDANIDSGFMLTGGRL
jgi:hypothetical protein